MFDFAFLIISKILVDESVVSNEKSDFSKMRVWIFPNKILPASIETAPGLNGDRALAIASALMYSLHFNISGKKENDEVVFPAPFAPAIMYSLGLLFEILRKFLFF